MTMAKEDRILAEIPKKFLKNHRPLGHYFDWQVDWILKSEIPSGKDWWRTDYWIAWEEIVSDGWFKINGEYYKLANNHSDKLINVKEFPFGRNPDGSPYTFEQWLSDMEEAEWDPLKFKRIRIKKKQQYELEVYGEVFTERQWYYS